MLLSAQGVKAGKGVLVFDVQPGSAAERAGLRKVTSYRFNGVGVNDANSFPAIT